MPIVHAQNRLATLQKIRLRDYSQIAAAVKAGREDEAEATGTAHVQHVRFEILARAKQAGVSG
jgi:DNA-binding FadR family transcriptional regulator